MNSKKKGDDQQKLLSVYSYFSSFIIMITITSVNKTLILTIIALHHSKRVASHSSDVHNEVGNSSI